MTTMRTSRWVGAALAAAAVGAAGCESFLEENTSPPAIVRVIAFDGSQTAKYQPAIVEVSSPGPITLAPVQIKDACNPTVFARNVFAIQLNKPMDGASIQATLTDCTPAAGGLTVTPGVVPPEAWYTCYYPSSTVVGTGASIWVAKTADQTAFWKSTLDLMTDYTISGNVKDQQGNSLAVNVTVRTTNDPAVVTLTPSASAVTLDWTVPAGTSSLAVQRAPDAAKAPGTFATLAGAGSLPASTITWSDTTVVAGTTYWYRVNVTDTNTLSSTGCEQSAAAMNAPAGPTYGTVTATSVVVDWAAATGAASYTVQRAPDSAGVPGAWVGIASGLTGVTYTDTGVVTATTYWYRIVAVASSGLTSNSPASSVTTP